LKILVIGVGQTGKKFAKMVLKKHEVYGTYHSSIPDVDLYGTFHLDKRNPQEVDNVLRKVSPEVVVDTATLQSTDYMEMHQKETWDLNVAGTKQLAKVCKELNALLVFISTDYVFDGKKGNYTENDIPNPINFYGKTKLLAETMIQNLCERYLIVRPSLIYSWDAELLTKKSGRSPSFPMWLISKLIEKQKLSIVSDMYSSPTLADNLAEMILELTERNKFGIYHTAGATPLSKFDFAKKICYTMGFSSDLIEPISSSKIGFEAPRPLNCSLNVTKAEQELIHKPIDIEKALQIFLKQARKNEWCFGGSLD